MLNDYQLLVDEVSNDRIGNLSEDIEDLRKKHNKLYREFTECKSEIAEKQRKIESHEKEIIAHESIILGLTTGTHEEVLAVNDMRHLKPTDTTTSRTWKAGRRNQRFLEGS